MSEYKPSLIVFPYRILYLVGLQLSYLKVYEIIFHLWHQDLPCFISNPEFCRRTGLADSTVREALAFFEEKGEFKRVYKGRRRYIVQPVRVVEVDSDIAEPVHKSPIDSAKTGHAAEIAAATRCQVGGLPAAKSAHNNTNLNASNLNKEKSFSIGRTKNGDKSKAEPKNLTKFWEPGNPDYDRVNS